MTKQISDRTRALLRHASTTAQTTHSIGGIEKKPHHSRKKITMPKTPWDDEKEQDDARPIRPDPRK